MLVRIVLWNLADSLTNIGYVWASPEAAEQELPSRARELIGKEPDVAEVFDLEASISAAPELARLGLAFEA